MNIASIAAIQVGDCTHDTVVLVDDDSGDAVAFESGEIEMSDIGDNKSREKDCGLVDCGESAVDSSKVDHPSPALIFP